MFNFVSKLSISNNWKVSKCFCGCIYFTATGLVIFLRLANLSCRLMVFCDLLPGPPSGDEVCINVHYLVITGGNEYDASYR